MGATVTSNIQNALRIHYTAKLNEVLFGRKHRVLLNTLAKKSFGGSDLRVPVVADHGGTVSAAFADAQTYAAPPQIASFNAGATLSELWRLTQIDAQALLRLKGDAQGLLNETREQINRGIDALADYLEWSLFRDATGVLARVGSSSGSDITLATGSDVKNFPIGAPVVFAATATGALRDSGDFLIVQSKAYNPSTGAGTITFTAAVSGIAGLANADYMFIKGTAANGGAVKCPYGLGKWSSTPSGGESFLGQDRNVNALALAMQTAAGSLTDILGAVRAADAQVHGMVGGSRDLCVLNSTNWQQLGSEVLAQTIFDPGDKARAGFAYLTIQGMEEPIKIVASPHCPINTAMLLDSSSWQIVHLGQAPVTLDTLDGQSVQRMATAAGNESRVFSMCQLVSNAPGWNVQITLS